MNFIKMYENVKEEKFKWKVREKELVLIKRQNVEYSNITERLDTAIKYANGGDRET